VLKPRAIFCCVLQVLGSGYLPQLLAVIPEENLPIMFGGKSACDCTDTGPWQVRAWPTLNTKAWQFVPYYTDAQRLSCTCVAHQHVAELAAGQE
jgi:hypothetical protein